MAREKNGRKQGDAAKELDRYVVSDSELLSLFSLFFLFFVLSQHLNCEQRQNGEGKMLFFLFAALYSYFYDDLGLEFRFLFEWFDF